MFGAFLTAVSQVGNAFAPNIPVLMFTQGALFGKRIAFPSYHVIIFSFYDLEIKNSYISGLKFEYFPKSSYRDWILYKNCLDFTTFLLKKYNKF